MGYKWLEVISEIEILSEVGRQKVGEVRERDER